MKNKVYLLILVAILTLGTVFGINSYNNFKISRDYSFLPLNYNPYDNTSVYQSESDLIKVTGGFIKAFRKNTAQKDKLVIRALAPDFTLEINNGNNSDRIYSIEVENVNALKIKADVLKVSQQKIIDNNTLLVMAKVSGKQNMKINFTTVYDKEYFEFIILGDNRNGYETFSNIIEQINSINPAFLIDNGDLVFDGKPNKYRLFYETILKLNVPIFTTLGNHDIRENGREIYTKLFGPPYYSFDYHGIHFVFLDSSRGWLDEIAIPEEEYKWLENDLSRAKDKKIIVISHIPPIDPRDTMDANTISEIKEEKYLEKVMDDYSKYKSMDHGFKDSAEAKRFEEIMTKYSVDTVFLSHIHSYFSYIEDGVKYVISGGAGAELLTKDTYYHYLRVKVTADDEELEMIQLPSPKNIIGDRYIAAIVLFSNSMYKEYKSEILGFAFVFLFFIFVVMYSYRRGIYAFIKFLYTYIKELAKFARQKYREMRKK